MPAVEVKMPRPHERLIRRRRIVQHHAPLQSIRNLTEARAVAPSRDEQKGPMPPLGALAVVVGAMALTGWSGQQFSPAPNHPQTRRWYRRLDKPGFTPPGPVFGAGWALIEAVLAYGGYRILRRRSSTARNAAVGLWVANNLLIAGWSALFFGRKALGPR